MNVEMARQKLVELRRYLFANDLHEAAGLAKDILDLLSGKRKITGKMELQIGERGIDEHTLYLKLDINERPYEENIIVSQEDLSPKMQRILNLRYDKFSLNNPEFGFVVDEIIDVISNSDANIYISKEEFLLGDVTLYVGKHTIMHSIKDKIGL